MKINDTLHGFRVTGQRRLEELSATLWSFTFEKNGAELLWLDREDSNMSYSIAFPTTPNNDTGVFHILEHSVLNGSEKFPLKEPFVDLLKCSMQTFLNAMTFSDKTMYPVSSRNKKDFLNLMDVYTDAVFHPCIYTRKETFLQEGWHYELREDVPVCTGVVYSEMQGAFASTDTVLGNAMARQLFPDSCYRYVSGGDPAAIPELSYEEFLNTHRKYYHPSNAKIFLDGSVDLPACLGLLEGYLKDYGRGEAISIGDQPPVTPEEYRESYEVPAGTTMENRAIWGKSFVYGTYRDTVKAAGMQVLADVLAGSNDAPLRKAIQEAGLAESFAMEANENTKYLLASMEAKNTDESKLPELKQMIQTTLTALAEQGLDREQLTASINALEFSARERDYGSLPKGIVFAISSLDTWLYGGDPADALCVGDTFDQLRKNLDKGYFETLIREELLQSKHCASVLLLPSETLGEERRKATAEKLEKIAQGWDAAQREQVLREAERLRTLQQQEDTPEQKACLPKLKLTDVAENTEPMSVVTEQIDGTKLLISPLETDGILYLDLYFHVRDFSREELPLLSFLSELYGEAGTDRHSAIELQSMLKRDLGSFDTNCEGFGIPEEAEYCLPWFTVSVSVLEGKADTVAPLLEEVLFHTVLRDRELVGKLLKQRRIAMRESISERGNSFAAGRVAASATARGVFHEFTSGLSYYDWVCNADDTFETEGELLLNRLQEIAGKLFCRERLAMGITGQPEPEWIAELLDLVPFGGKVGKAGDWSPLPKGSEGFEIPADIGFAAKGTNLYPLHKKFHGSMAVGSQLLSLNYLWNEIRVQHGAYGAGMGVGNPGELRFSTFRDPDAENSLRCFDQAPEFLRNNLPDGETLTSLIISTCSETEPVRTPRMQGKHEITLTLSGVKDSRLQEIRSEILHTDCKDLEKYADILEDVLQQSAVCVIGGKAILEKCGEKLSHVRVLK